MIDILTGEKLKYKEKCNIHNNWKDGKCKKDADIYIFGTCLCDNHYHLISGKFVKDNVIKKEDK